MRAPAVCAIIAAIGLAAHPAFAQGDRTAATFWKSVQATCNATAAKPPSELGRRIAKTAIDEFNRFGGHQIDSNGRLFRFGLTEAENEEDDGGGPQASLGHLGWWQVMKYWRSLYGSDAPDKLEVRGYRDASNSAQDAQVAALLRTSAGRLLRLAEEVSDPGLREILRETAFRAAVVDTSWSAAFVSYVIRQSGVAPNAFQFANAHRAYIYDAFAVSAAESAKEAGGDGIYRACPLTTTKPRPGDLICQQREPALADINDESVRERIRMELSEPAGARSVRRTHCEVVAYVDVRARKVYTIGGNVNQSVSARKLNLKNDLRFSPVQKGHCGAGQWTLPSAAGDSPKASGHAAKCSLNDKKWFVLLQLR